MPGPIGRTGRLLRDRRGATAVEFAMLVGPMALMIFALVQLALYFWVQVTLDNATALAARSLRTGFGPNGAPVIADGSSDTAGRQAFAQAICSNMSWLQSQCANNLVVDVRTLATYSSQAASPTLNSSGGASGTCFYSGSAGSAVELRTYYRWTLAAAALLQSLETAPGGGASELQSTEVFQVEPNGQTNPATTQC